MQVKLAIFTMAAAAFKGSYGVMRQKNAQIKPTFVGGALIKENAIKTL